MASSSNLLGGEQFSSVTAAPANEENKGQPSESFLGYIPFSKPPRATKRSRGGSSGFAAAAALPGSIMGKLTSWFAGSSAGATSKKSTASTTAASSAGAEGLGGSAVGTSPQPRNPFTSGADDSHLSRKARRKKHRHERSEERKREAAERAEAERCYLESLRHDEGTGQPLGDAVRSIDDGLPIRDFIYSSAVGRLYYSTRDEICKPFGFYHGQRVIIKKGPLQGLRAIIIGVHGGQLHAIFEGETEASPFLRCYNARHLQEEFALEAISPPRSVKIASLPVPLDVPERVHNFLRFAPDLTLEIALNQNDGTAADEAARVAAVEAKKRKKAEEEAAKKKKKQRNANLSKQNGRKEGALPADPKAKRRGGGGGAVGEEDSNDSDGPSELTNAAKLALRAASSASRLRRSVTMTPNNNNKVSYAHHSMLRRSISFADAADLEIASPPNLVKSGATHGPSSRAVRLTTVMEGGDGVDNGDENNNNNQHRHHQQQRRERENREGETPNGHEDEQNDWFLSRSFDAEQEGAGFYDEGDADAYYLEEDDEDEDEDDSSSSISESDDDDDEAHYNSSSSTPLSAINPFIPYTEPRTPRPGVVVVYMTPTYALANGGSVGWSGEAIQPISGAGNIHRTQLFNFEAASFVRAKKEIGQTLEDLLLAPSRNNGKVLSPRSSMSYFVSGAAVASGGTAASSSSPLPPFSATVSPAPAPVGLSSSAAANSSSSADVILREALTVLDIQKQMLSTATQPMIASISVTVVVPLVLSRGAVDALASTVDAVEEAEAETDGSNAIANASFRTGGHGIAANSTDGGDTAIYNPTVAPPEAVGDFLKKIVSAAEVFQAKAQEAVRDANKMFGLRSEFDMDAEFLAANQ